MRPNQVILTDREGGGWVEARFRFDKKILGIMQGLSFRKFDGKKKCWEFPKHVIPEVKTKLLLHNIQCIDESTEEIIFIRITENGFRLSCEDIPVTPVSWRLLYLRRPRDGYAYAKELEKFGYQVIINDEFKPFPLPQMTSKVELRQYQKESMTFLEERDYCGVIAFAVGGGKTIVGAESVYRIGEGPVLIVVPTSLLYQWQRVFKKFYNLDVDVVTSRIKKDKRVEVLESSPIVLTNYELLRTVSFKRQYSLLILDEVHRLRNWKTKISESISKIVAKRVIGLTGTLINNNLFEAYNVSEQVLPGALGTLKEFNDRFVVRDVWGGIDGYKDLEAAHDLLKDVVIRKTKEEMLPDLPSLTEELVVVELSNAEKKGYRQLMGRSIDIGSVSNAKVFCSSSSLKMDINVSSKEKELLEQVANVDERVIVFTQYEKELQRIKNLIRKESNRPIFEISGKIKNRQQMVDNFIKEEEAVMIMTEAGSEGIDGLQVCNVLINMDMPYTHVRYEQRVGRIHRSGNESNKITVINLISNLDFDWNILEIVEGKKQLADVVIDGQKMSGTKGFLLSQLKREFERK